MAELIPFEQLKRAKRLCSIIVEQVGLEHFTLGSTFLVLQNERLDEALALCVDWLEHQTASQVSVTVKKIIRQEIRRRVLTKMAETMVSNLDDIAARP